MRTITNRYPGECRNCGETVDAGTGLAIQGEYGWNTEHNSCEKVELIRISGPGPFFSKRDARDAADEIAHRREFKEHPQHGLLRVINASAGAWGGYSEDEWDVTLTCRQANDADRAEYEQRQNAGKARQAKRDAIREARKLIGDAESLEKRPYRDVLDAVAANQWEKILFDGAALGTVYGVATWAHLDRQAGRAWIEWFSADSDYQTGDTFRAIAITPEVEAALAVASEDPALAVWAGR